jgi:hypothetical protein
MKRNVVTAILLTAGFAALLVGQAACTPTTAETGGPEAGPEAGDRTISVSGSGTVAADPDRVVVRLGVETMAETAEAALSENSEQMQAVIDALTEAGVPEENIQTQTVRLEPQYASPEREPGQPTERELVGYLAANVVRVSSEDLDGIGDLLDAATQAGANRVEGISFEVTNPEDVLGEARELAWENARQKAEQLAGLSAAELGDVLSISESTRGPQPVFLGAEREAAAVPIQPGTEEIRVDLQVVWALE